MKILKLLRLLDEYSIKEASELLGVSKTFLNYMETGLAPSEQLLNRIRELYGLPAKLTWKHLSSNVDVDRMKNRLIDISRTDHS